ncbi:MAG: DUF1761 domain-containing protein [Bacteroidota bacterium]
MEANWWVIFVAALIPMVLGFIWYNPAVFGKAWMQASGMTDEKIKGGNMPLIFGISFVFSCMLALVLTSFSIHQLHIQSVFADPESTKLLADPNSELSIWMKGVMDKIGNRSLSFGHGFFHGIIGGIFFSLPILGTNALFERRSAKYILVNCGYWAICLALMCGFICQFFLS